MGLIREFFGGGTLFGIEVLTDYVPGMGIFNLAPGGFFVFAILIAAVNYITKGKGLKKKEFGCEGCAMSSMCGGARKEKMCIRDRHTQDAGFLYSDCGSKLVQQESGQIRL